MNSRMDQRVIEDVDTTVMSLEEGKAAAAGAGIAVGATLAVIGILKKVLGGNRK